jgi:hypothetical protein
MRVLVTGWPSFRRGEATAGDVLSMRAARAALEVAGVPCETAWSPVFRPEGLNLADADPGRYTHLLFICGPLHGEQIEWLHERYARCRRVAAGVSVLDPAARSVTGFHHVLPRDGPGTSTVDLSGHAVVHRVPVTGVVLASGQPEYAGRQRHDQVHALLTRWLDRLGCAVVPLDTRLDTTDWRLCSTPDQLVSIFERLDVVVTTRLHGLVLSLRAGTPALAVDPIDGGGKVSAQAGAYRWPALVGARNVSTATLDRWWDWCLSPAGVRGARAAKTGRGDPLLSDLLAWFADERAREKEPMCEPPS